MGKFNKGGGFGGNRGGGSRFGGRSFGKPSFKKKSWGDKPEMHQAVCSNCGKDCEVPFRPTGEKPVYCNDCFGKKGGGSDRAPRRDFDNRLQTRTTQSGFSGDGANNEIKKQLEALISKVDKLTNIVENNLKPKADTSSELTAQEKFAIRAINSLPVKTTKKKVVKTVKKPTTKKKAKK